MKKSIFLILNLLILCSMTYSQESIELWPEKKADFQTIKEKESSVNEDMIWLEDVKEPTLEVFLPTKLSATGQAVVICPGGGYEGLAYDWEGTDVAKYFNSKGIAAFVLKYRLPKPKQELLAHNAPLQDAQRAIRLVRLHAEKWNINKNKVGIMGFSAGGHLASTLGVHYNEGKSLSGVVDTINARPDFMVLIYPVITMKSEFTHEGSRNALLDKKPTQDLIDFYSNELHVTENTPPTFIVHSTNDDVVLVKNSLLIYEALEEKEIPVEMHIYPYGDHGYGLAVGRGYLQTWTDRLTDWIKSIK